MKKKDWKECQKIQRETCKKLIQFCMESTDREAVLDAWDCFAPDEEEDLNDAHPLFPMFMSWMLFNFVDDICDNRIIAKDFLKQKKNSLNPLEQEYLQSALNSSFSFWEVLEVTPGEKMTIVDLLGETECTVYEASGSLSVKPGDLTFAKIATINGTNLFEAMAPIAIPSRFSIEILHFKHWLQDNIGPIKNERISFNHQMDTLDCFHEIYFQLMNPTPPILTNTDGQLLVPHKIIFEVDSADQAFEALYHLCHMETKKEIMKMARYVDGKLKQVDFPWLSKPTKKRPQPIVLGKLHINGKELMVEVNSTERADLFKKTIKKAMPEGSYKFKRSVIDNIEKQLQTIPKDSPKERPPHTLEMEKALEQYFQDHWAKWPREKLPALNNKRPIDVVKTSKGRELVDALISDFEKSYAKNPLPGMKLEILKDLRKKLGI